MEFLDLNLALEYGIHLKPFKIKMPVVGETTGCINSLSSKGWDIPLERINDTNITRKIFKIKIKSINDVLFFKNIRVKKRGQAV